MNAIQNENRESGKGLLSGQSKKVSSIEEFIEICTRNAWKVSLRKTEDIEEIRQDLAVRAVEKWNSCESAGKPVTSGLAWLIVKDETYGRRWSGRVYTDATSEAQSLDEEPEEGITGSIPPPVSPYFRTDYFVEFIDFVEVMNSILDEQKAKVFEALMAGHQQNEIAGMLGLSKGRISKIVSEIVSIAQEITA